MKIRCPRCKEIMTETSKESVIIYFEGKKISLKKEYFCLNCGSEYKLIKTPSSPLGVGLLPVVSLDFYLFKNTLYKLLGF